MNVMIICDNRNLLKQIYAYIMDESEYNIFMVKFSQSTMEEFLKWKPSIVIIDEDVVVSYQTILRQLDQSGWSYQAIILSSLYDKQCEFKENRYYISKNNITKDEILTELERIVHQNKNDMNINETNINENSSIQSFDDMMKQDIYLLIGIRYLETEIQDFAEKRLTQVKEIMQPFGKENILFADEKTIILLIGKSQMKAFVQAEQISESFRRNIGNQSAIFIYNNIGWNKLSDAYSNLEQSLAYSYFYKEQVVLGNEWKRNRDQVEISSINEVLVNILASVFSFSTKEIESSLRALLFHMIGEKLDFDAIKYVRRMTIVMERFCCSLMKKPSTHNESKYSSLLEEYDNLLKRYMGLADCMKEINLLPIIKKVILYVLAHYKEDITLDSVAEELRVSKAYLSRIFRQELTITFLDFLQTLRIQEAKHYLIHTNKKITDIAQTVGYYDAHYFSRLFKKRTNYAPEMYKKLIKELADEIII